MQVFLDLDGVLVDFDKGICQAHGIDPVELGHRSWDYPLDKLGMTAAEFWAPSDSPEFWANLEWTADGERILEAVTERVALANICLLTSPTIAPECAAGKMMWIQKNLPEFSRRFLIGSAKYFCAGPGKVLIDDRDENCMSFSDCGGFSILVPRPWNQLRDQQGIATWVVDQGLYFAQMAERKAA